MALSEDKDATIDALTDEIARLNIEVSTLFVENELMADWIRLRGGITSHFRDQAKEIVNGPKPEPSK